MIPITGLRPANLKLCFGPISNFIKYYYIFLIMTSEDLYRRVTTVDGPTEIIENFLLVIYYEAGIQLRYLTFCLN